MGERTISSTLKIDGDIAPDFSFDWEIEFKGEKYIMPLRIPQGSKENTSLNSTIELTFQHWAIYQLKRWPFVTIQQIAAGTYLADEEEASVSLNLKDFCTLFGQVLEYYYGSAITIDLNPEWEYDSTATVISISHTKIWNVLSETLYDKFGVRWEIEVAPDNSNTTKGGEKYIIKVGYPTTEVDHIFEYGFKGGLLKLERQVQSEEIRNVLKGRGGDTNIPFRYFKNTDPDNPDFLPDPDWVEELANIYFPNLMPATFRSYIQGWKAAHISKYSDYTAVGESSAYSAWAYRKGYTDEKFSPVEFVADEITLNPTTDDKQVQILPSYAPYVKKGSSLDKYGTLPDTLDNNDDIYPTLQGTGLDIAVDVEQVTDDDSEQTDNDTQSWDTAGTKVQASLSGGERKRLTTSKVLFSVPKDKTANLEIGSVTAGDTNVLIEDYFVYVYDAATGEQRSASGIPSGTYRYEVVIDAYNASDTAVKTFLVVNYVKLTSSTIGEQRGDVFDLWVRNIWSSSKQLGESDTEYSERVWESVLGDREGNEAKVMFTSGALALSEDYEFTIVGYPVYDNSKSYTDKDEDNNDVVYTSHWRITLTKSDAEYETTGKLIPNSRQQGKAGDTFVFIGTEMMHDPYVIDAEKRLDDWKKDQLEEKKEIKPTYVVTTDRVRLNNSGQAGALIETLHIGCSVRIADSRFIQAIDGAMYETLYLQSITYKYREPSNSDTALNPDVEITLGEEYTTSADTVSLMQGEINALQRQVGSISNVAQIAQSVGDRRYARKSDGVTERIGAVWDFLRNMQSLNYNADALGSGWWLGLEGDGLSRLVVDRLYVRYKAIFDALEIRHISQVGGVNVLSPAGGVFTSVEQAQTYLNRLTLCDSSGKELRDANGAVLSVADVDSLTDVWRCRLRTDDGEQTVTNDFAIGDLVQCRTFNLSTSQRFYWRRCVGVGADYIDLSMTDCADGSDTPMAGDSVVTLGNAIDTARQGAISLAAYGDGAPSITLYQGIGTYSTAGCDKTLISPYGSHFTGDFVVNTQSGEIPLAQFLADRISLSVTNPGQSLVVDNATATDIADGGGNPEETYIDFRSAAFAAMPAGARIALEVDINYDPQMQDVTVELSEQYGFTPISDTVAAAATMRFETTLKQSPGQNTLDDGQDPAQTIFDLYVSLPWEQVIGWRIYALPLAAGLKDTGIDIEAGRITLKGDTEIITNDGSTAALFREGKIKAEYVEADELTATRVQTAPISDTAKAHTLIEAGRQVYYDDEGNVRLLVHSGELSDDNAAAGDGVYMPQLSKTISGDERAAAVEIVGNAALSATSQLDLTDVSILLTATFVQGSASLPDFGDGAYYGNIQLSLYDECGDERTLIAAKSVSIPGTGTFSASFADFGKVVLASGTHSLIIEARLNTALSLQGTWGLYAPAKTLPLACVNTATEIAADGAALRASESFVKVLSSGIVAKAGDYALRISVNGIEASRDGGSSWEEIFT